jgi:hypothetical protein
MPEDFRREADRAIRSARPPHEARRRYLRLAEEEQERAAIARREEMIHMWETMGGQRPSP